MTRPSAQYITLTFGVLLLAASASHAQVLAPGNRPILSPWFGLYQRNSGPLDNYHTFVQPRIELDNTLQRHRVAIQRNYEGVASLNRGLSQIEEQGQVHPTGTGSVFMAYSHYYPSLTWPLCQKMQKHAVAYFQLHGGDEYLFVPPCGTAREMTAIQSQGYHRLSTPLPLRSNC